MAKIGKVQTAKKGYNAKTCHPKNRTIDSTKNHLKVKLETTITLDQER